MRDEDKVREQLIDELVELRKRIAELEVSEAERKKKVVESEERYRILVENTLDVIYTCSSDATITYWSPQGLSIGFPPEEIVGHNAAEFIHPDDVDRVLSDLQKTMQTGEGFPTDFRLINPGGEVIHVEETGKVIRDGERIVGLTGAIRDISRRREAEEALRYRTEFENLITNVSTDFINFTSDEIDDGIDHALRAIGEFSGVGRSYVFQFCDDGAKADNTHEWCTEGIKPQIDNLKNLCTEAFPWWMKKLKLFEDIHIPRVADLPPEARSEREVLQAQDIQSLIVVPMVCSGDLIGFLGFDSVREEKVWEEDAIDLLRIVGEMFANALERRRAEEELREYHDYLEELVKERTADLSKANEKLQQKITEHRQVAEELRKSEEKYRALVENANEVILVVQDGMLKFVNPRAMELTGYSEDELISTPFAEFLHPDDRAMAVELYLRKLKGEETPDIYPVRIIDKEGNIRWVETGVVLITWEGRPATMNFLSDITERKQAAEDVKRLARFPGENPNPVLRIEKDGTILYANEASLNLLSVWGCQVGQPLPDHWREFTLDVLGSGSAKSTEVECEDRILSLMFAPVADAGYVNVYGLDITERKQMEEELVKVEKLESIGLLAGGIAHDFNNILTGVMGNISLVGMYVESGKETGKILERLKEAERASMRAKELTQQLLTFSKGGAPILQVSDIGDLLKYSASFALSGTNVRCEFSIPDGLWTVEIDEGQINQVISNLVINAQQAMPEGGVVRISAENTIIDAESVLPLESGAYIKASIEDQGTGILQEHLRRIFDPFFSTKQAGSGLGLTTSHSIVQKHNGHITVESEVGVGTTFYVYLPASSGETLIVEKKGAERPITGEGKILVMDDQKYVRDLATEMLSSLGYKVTVAIDGTEAFEIYKQAMEVGAPFDIVIMDLTIPGDMGGKATIEKLMEIDPDVKAIVSSGYSNDPILADFGKYGFRGVIAKPYEVMELSKVLHRVITGAD